MENKKEITKEIFERIDELIDETKSPVPVRIENSKLMRGLQELKKEYVKDE